MTPDPRWSTVDAPALALGLELTEAVPRAEWPTWAADVLAACEARYGGITPVQDVLAIARDRTQWHLARTACQCCLAVHDAAWQQGKTRKVLLLDIATTVAKVTYNASDPADPFEAGAIHYLAARAHAFVDDLGDPALELAVWRLLVRRS